MQSKLWYEDEYEALRLMISNSGKKFGDIAVFLYPDKKYETAYARLKNSLDPDKDEFLKFGEIIRLMKFCNCYDPLMHACDETMHARPDRKSAEDEKVKVVDVINNAVGTIQLALGRLENLKRHEASK